MLAEKAIEIDGKAYSVRERTMREVLPVLEGDPKQRGLGLMKISVYNGGAEPLGDAVLDLGFREYSQLQHAVTDVYGMGDDQGNAP